MSEYKRGLYRKNCELNSIVFGYLRICKYLGIVKYSKTRIVKNADT